MIRACSRSRLRNPAVGSGSAFNPLSLFTAGEQGVWFDPSDLTTLFQDDAGTVPVTTDGQAVALMRDKSGNANHAAQTVVGSRPLYRTSAGLSWLEFDGVDDFMVTGSINLTATDEVSLFAGIRKLSDAARGMVCEFSPNVGLNNGTFFLDAPTNVGNNISFAARGTIAGVPVVAGLVAPISLVVSADANISADSARVRANGGAYSTSANDMGISNFATFPLYIGRRGGATLPFSGLVYGLIIRNALTGSVSILNTEQYIGAKSGVAL